jgi:hypothetical protein
MSLFGSVKARRRIPTFHAKRHGANDVAARPHHARIHLKSVKADLATEETWIYLLGTVEAVP